MSNELATTQPKSVKEYLSLPAYKSRFEEVLKSRAPQFMAAITSLASTPSLSDAEPKSIIAAAMVAATLDLPVNPTLGQAWVIAYRDGNRKVAQFQLGYRGYIQLAQRTGQYKKLNGGPVNAEVFSGYDFTGEPVLDFSKFDPAKDAAGFFCAFETITGFQKVVYWTREQVERHAKRFSKGYGSDSSRNPWKSDFDAMATKTVIKAALTKWGVLSVELQKAAIHDQGAQEDLDADVKYVDGEDKTAGAPDEGMPGDPAPVRPAPPPRAKKGAAAVAENAPATKTVGPEVAGEIVTETVVESPRPRDNAADHAAMGKIIEETKAEEVKAATAAPEPSPAPVQSFADAAKATEAAPVPAPPPTATQPRAFLNDLETLETTIRVKDLKCSVMKSGDATFPTAKASVTGGYVGDIYHKGGAKLVSTAPDVYEPLPPWKVGAELKVTLLGQKNAKGMVVAYVQSVEAVQDEF